MKKTTAILASAVALVMAGSAIAETTVYGRARMAVVVASDNDNLGVINDSSRFGFKGTEDLGNGMSAVYHFELGYTADEQGGGVGNRIGLVGVKGDFGTALIGTTWGPSYNLVEGNLDPFNHFGKIGGYALGGRWSDVVAYANKFGDVSFQGAVVADEADTDDLADGYNLAVNFPAGPVSIGIGYLDITAADSAMALSVNYNGDGFTVGFGYADNEDLGGDKITTVQATMNVGSAGKVLLQYGALDNADVNGTIVGYHHNLSKRTQAYLESATEDAAGGNASTVIGLKHNF